MDIKFNVLERILVMGITGAGKSYQWLQIANMLLPTGAIFRVIDTDNDKDYMLRTQFPQLLPENGGNVYVHNAFDWQEYKHGVKWINHTLPVEQVKIMDKHLLAAYNKPIQRKDWVVVDKINRAWKTVQSYFVTSVFGDDPGEYFLTIRKQIEEGLIKTAKGQKPASTITEGLDGWKDWCVDQETEILTQSGWKKYSDLTREENVFTLSPTLGRSVWEPLLDIHVGQSYPRKMIHMNGASHDSLTTFDHRWLVEIRARGQYHYAWRTSETLKANHRIPMCVPPLTLPVRQVYSDALVEIVAWYITEGWCSKKREHRQQLQGTISQSYIKNPDNVKRIRLALYNLVPEFGVLKEGHKSNGVTMWHLTGKVMSVLEEIAPNKCPTYKFLLQLTQKQLEIFTEVCILADGSVQSMGQKSFDQKRSRKDVVEAFEFACILQGKAIRTHLRIEEDKFGDPESYEVQVLQKSGAWPVNAAEQVKSHVRTETPQGKATCKIVDYDGVVWCPVTPSGTWLAKRNGTIYFTGNSVINKLYDDWISPIVYQVQCHVYAATDVESLDRNDKDQELQQLFGELGVRPSGQKELGGQYHSIFLFLPGKDRWLITTAKDRANRAYFTKEPLVSLFPQYLIVKAGWTII